MLNKKYLKQNMLGFEGDEFIAFEIKNLIEKFSIDVAVELGSFHGFTARKIASLVKEVITVEIDEMNYQVTCFYTKKVSNIKAIHSSSVDALPKILQEYKEKNILIFIDSHWQQYCPLLDELKIIAQQKIKPVIAIHDFKVPGQPQLKFDSYNQQEFTYEWIKPHIDKIYGEGEYNYHYNRQSTGAKRGVIYIYPKSIK